MNASYCDDGTDLRHRRCHDLYLHKTRILLHRTCGWWYVSGGKVDFGYTGVTNCANACGWWYISGGKADVSYTGWAASNYGRWYVSGGKVCFK